MEDDTPPIFNDCLETFSQDALLDRCDFALQRDHPDSQPSTAAPPQKQNHPDTPPSVAGASEKMETGSDRRPDAEVNTAVVDLEPEAVETVHVASEEQRNLAEGSGASQDVSQKLGSGEEVGSRVLEKNKDPSDQPMSSGNLKDGGLKSPVKEKERTKMKIPLREVVKAIVMNSRDHGTAEEEGELEKMNYVQILMKKGFKFPD